MMIRFQSSVVLIFGVTLLLVLIRIMLLNVNKFACLSDPNIIKKGQFFRDFVRQHFSFIDRNECMLSCYRTRDLQLDLIIQYLLDCEELQNFEVSVVFQRCLYLTLCFHKCRCIENEMRICGHPIRQNCSVYSSREMIGNASMWFQDLFSAAFEQKCISFYNLSHECTNKFRLHFCRKYSEYVRRNHWMREWLVCLCMYLTDVCSQQFLEYLHKFFKHTFYLCSHTYQGIRGSLLQKQSIASECKFNEIKNNHVDFSVNSLDKYIPFASALKNLNFSTDVFLRKSMPKMIHERETHSAENQSKASIHFSFPNGYPPQTDLNDYGLKVELLKRPNRDIGQVPVPPVMTSCLLHLVADHLFFSNVGESSESKTASAMTAAVFGADAIFRNTDFDHDGTADNIGFQIENITIFTDYSKSFFSYSLDNNDHIEYLKNFSKIDHSHYCLAVVFTYKEFKQGVSGVAWIASSSPEGEPGGICQTPVYLKQEMAYYSFNTVVISFLIHNVRIGPEQAILILTHEFGHSFGSNHDQDLASECSLAYLGGQYLMNHFSSTGDMPNNRRFSPCSSRTMHPVIVKKGSCLQRHTGIRCGNSVIEEGEECDCGTSGTCKFIDSCCTPADVLAGNPDYPCTLRKFLNSSQCSPVASKCCTPDCKIIAKSAGVVCKESTDCHFESVCNGLNDKCPDLIQKANGTLCSGGTNFCQGGQCSGSICESWGYLDCLCSKKFEDLCKLCCQTSREAECQPAHEFGILSPLNYTIFLSLGAACIKKQYGICNEQHKCISHSDLEYANLSFESESNVTFSTLFLNYLPYILIAVISVYISLSVYKYAGFYLHNAHVWAIQYGKIFYLFSAAKLEEEKIKKNIAACEFVFEKILNKLRTGNSSVPEEFLNAVSRLITFFPTAPLPHLISTALKCSTEDVAVRILLAKGYPMRNFMPQSLDSLINSLGIHLNLNDLLQLNAWEYIEPESESEISRESGSQIFYKGPAFGPVNISLEKFKVEVSKAQKSLQDEIIQDRDSDFTQPFPSKHLVYFKPKKPEIDVYAKLNELDYESENESKSETDFSET